MEMTTIFSLHAFVLFLCFIVTPTKAYDPLDPNGYISVKWDVKEWTSDGYAASVTISNLQRYRHIEAPGWTLGWSWAKDEVIWNMVGAQATDQGDCSRFRANTPHCCKKDPTVVDLMPGTPYNQQISNCCRGGVLSSSIQDPATSVSSFLISVGSAGTNDTSVDLPQNFTLGAAGSGYTCGPANIVDPSEFFTPDRRRVTRALMTWNLTCTYSQFLAQRTPTCCVSLSAFYNDTIVPCPTCACSCQNTVTLPGSCVKEDSPYLATAIANAENNNDDALIQCTRHMCPIRVHWHVKLNYKEYWRVKITITNFNYRKNYTHWNLVVQHPNFNNLTEIFSFNYDSLAPYEAVINDTAMLWGIKYYNDMLIEAGPLGNVQTELLFRKNPDEFTFKQGWAFPRRIYFNGDNCVLPPPDAYPWLPNSGLRRQALSFLQMLICTVSLLLLLHLM